MTLRKLASDVEDAVLLDELAMLEARWQAIRAEADKGGRPRRLTGDEHALERLVRALMDPELRRIEVADEGLLARCRRLVDGPLRPHGVELIRLEPDSGAFEQTEVAGEIEAALSPEVRLRGGGRLVIEPTRAFVAVDVDGAGRAALDVDMEAAFELAHQVRLRNLGGTIVVDFVDLPTKAPRQRLEDTLKRAFRGDPAPLQIYPMSPLGLVQISRARRGRSLEARLRRACSVCEGTGRIPSLRAAAEQLALAVRTAQPRSVRLAPDLAAYLDGEAAAMWRGIGSTLRVERDPEARAGRLRSRGRLSGWPTRPATRKSRLREPRCPICGKPRDAALPALLLEALPRPRLSSTGPTAAMPFPPSRPRRTSRAPDEED